MTRTEKLLVELIAVPSVNPAFVPPSSAVGPRCRAASDDQQVVPTNPNSPLPAVRQVIHNVQKFFDAADVHV